MNTVTDILDLKRFKRRKFKGFKNLVGINYERQAAVKAKEIFNDFLMLMGQDLVDNNDCYVLAKRGFGYINVANIANPNSPDYVYNIETDGKIYGPKLKLDIRIMRFTRLHFRVEFGKELQTRLESQVAAGHKY